jgi:hypothetical protein
MNRSPSAAAPKMRASFEPVNAVPPGPPLLLPDSPRTDVPGLELPLLPPTDEVDELELDDELELEELLDVGGGVELVGGGDDVVDEQFVRSVAPSVEK